jgi:hypothetical protein
MTATEAARRSRLRQHWHRLAIPFTALLLLVSVTWLAHHQEQPNLRDSETLSPAAAGPDGASQLAGMLAHRGVDIVHLATYAEAHDALAEDRDVVVFIPKPTYAGALIAWEAAQRNEVDRVVVVAPNQRELAVMGAPVHSGPRRWAARAELPGCDLPEAVAAGRATALRNRYAGPELNCYAGGLARARLGRTELIVVGATDPFRNRRIDEHGNAVLALELLSTTDRIIWLDALPASLDLSFNRPQIGAPSRPEVEAPSRRELDRTASSGLGALVYAYPPGVLAALGLAAVLAVLIALARARRLGPPVSEPLPVRVPAAEAVAGRGRLYLRAKGRAAALETLRAAARQRLMPDGRSDGGARAATPDPETVVATVAARSGLPAEQVHRTLYGPVPDSDEDLASAVADLDRLAATITHRGGAT